MRLQRSIITYGSGISACEKSLEEWGWSLHLLAELLTRSLQGLDVRGDRHVISGRIDLQESKKSQVSAPVGSRTCYS